MQKHIRARIPGSGVNTMFGQTYYRMNSGWNSSLREFLGMMIIYLYRYSNYRSIYILYHGCSSYNYNYGL